MPEDTSTNRQEAQQVTKDIDINSGFLEKLHLYREQQGASSEENSKYKQMGWNGLGKSHIYYNDVLKEYVYEVIEPELTEEENRLKDQLVYLFKINSTTDVSEQTEPQKITFLEETLNSIIKMSGIPIPESSKDRIFYYIIREFIGYGKIDLLLRDEGIEDISCDGKNIPIFVYHRDHESIRTNIVFETDDELDSFVVKLSQVCGKQISIYEPIIDGKLPDGSRLQATLARTVTQGSTFTIRRFRDNPLTPLDLIETNTLSIEMVAYFWIIMEYGSSILFCGGTASGKTTALNALSLFIPPAHKIVSIEDTREINLPHENWIAGTSRSGFSTTEKEKTNKDIDMFDLIRAALRQRPRVIIVGEVRGKEAYTLFQAMATGHLSYSTMHASDIQTLIQRLESPPISLPRSLLTSLDVIVFLRVIKTPEGSIARRITSAVEIVKHDPNSGRLVSVTPFTWAPHKGDSFEYSGGSNLYEKIRNDWGWTNDELREEIKRRIEIIKWMKKNNINGYLPFGRIIAEYKKDPQGLLRRVRADAS